MKDNKFYILVINSVNQQFQGLIDKVNQLTGLTFTNKAVDTATNMFSS